MSRNISFFKYIYIHIVAARAHMIQWHITSYPKGPLNYETPETKKIAENMNIPGVYVLYIRTKSGRMPKYIGQTENIRDRLYEYEKLKGHTEELTKLLKDYMRSGNMAVKYTKITTESERERMECHLIKYYDKRYDLINKIKQSKCSGRLDFTLPID